MISITVRVDSAGLDAMGAGLTRAQGASPPGPIRDLYSQWGRRVQVSNEERFDRFSIGGGDWAPLALSTIRARKKAAMHGKAGTVTRFNSRFDGSGTQSRGARSSLARDTRAGRGGALVSAGRTVSILKDTGILRAGLKIGNPGSTFEMIPGGFVYGVDGKAPHPPKPGVGGKGGTAVALVATRAGTAGGRGTPSVRAKGGARKAMSIGDIAAIHQKGGGKLPRREIIVVPPQEVIDAMAGDAIAAVLRLGKTGGA